MEWNTFGVRKLGWCGTFSVRGTVVWDVNVFGVWNRGLGRERFRVWNRRIGVVHVRGSKIWGAPAERRRCSIVKARGRAAHPGYRFDAGFRTP